MQIHVIKSVIHAQIVLASIEELVCLWIISGQLNVLLVYMAIGPIHFAPPDSLFGGILEECLKKVSNCLVLEGAYLIYCFPPCEVETHFYISKPDLTPYIQANMCIYACKTSPLMSQHIHK